MKKLFWLLLVFLPFATRAQATDSISIEPSDGQKRAAESLLRAINIDRLLKESVDKSLDAQIATNEKARKYRPVMEEFFGRYMSWKALKQPLVLTYARAFTEKELMELEAFYKTPIGQKALTAMPTVMQQGMELGQRQVKLHLPELEQMISDYNSKHKDPVQLR